MTATGLSFDVTNPADGSLVGSVPDCGAAEVRTAVDAAAAALDGWRSLPAIDRGRLLRAAAELLRERADRIAAVMTSEQGKPLREAAGEVEYAAGFFDWFAGEAERVYGEIVPSPARGKRLMVLRRPVGVTAAITPWNFPAAMLTRKLGPALAAGCTAVVKPAEATPLTAIEICHALADAGVPRGVVNIVTSTRPAEIADALLGDARVRKLSFTGSTAVGKELIRGSAEHVTRLSLELGGHAPYLVFEDADVDGAVARVIASKFRNAGQTCICANRVFVQRAIHDRFVAQLADRVAELVVGPGSEPGVDIGPLIDGDAAEKVHAHVEDAQRRGARVLVGGAPPADRRYGGHFFLPTVLSGITTDMRISQEETFGPVVGVAAFESDEEAVALANGTPYGLAAYVETWDYERLFRLAEVLEFGVIGVNDGAPSTPSGPFGGLKESGIGREGGAEGIHEYLDVKLISIGGFDARSAVGAG